MMTRISTIALILLLANCGGEEAVTAIDLTSGQTKSFGSESEVPAGWAVCEADGCASVAPSIPCQNLGPAVCELRPGCRLAPTSQPGGAGSVPGSGGAGSVPGGTPNDEGNFPPEPVETACVQDDVVRCEDLDAHSCGQRPGCQWEAACPSGTDCPGICSSSNVTDCEALDRSSCKARQDCSWAPQACPMCPGQDGNDASCQCPSFCQSVRTTCPTLAPPPPDHCPGGQALPRFDSAGCVVGYDCAIDCVATPQNIECPGGTAVPVYDAQGCIASYRCDAGASHCDELASSYRTALQQAKRCGAGLATNCAKLVPDALTCGCDTYVNSANGQAIARLENLRKEAEQSGCFEDLACPAIACIVSSQASCETNTASGEGQCVGD